MARFPVLAVLLVVVAAGDAVAHGTGDAAAPLDEAAALATSQAAIGRIVGDHAFLDRRGDGVRLSDYRGRPLVVSLIYTGCTETCPLILQTLYRSVAVGREALGPDSFAVVTVGFDSAADTPERMRAYARAQGIDLPGWEFLSADHDTIDRLAADLGFVYVPSPKGFDHLAQTTVIDAEGRVYRQVYGADFDPPAVVEPLKQLVFGRRAPLADLSGLIDRVRLLCTLYDPASQRYRFDYSIFIGMIVGLGSLAAVGFILVRGWLRTRRPRPSM